jgi:hypothetical protein
MADIESVWQRIEAHAGERFTQIRGGEFTYSATARTLKLDRTNRSISWSAVEKALSRVPLATTSEVSDLSAPSYVYAILMDDRIRRGEW